MSVFVCVHVCESVSACLRASACAHAYPGVAAHVPKHVGGSLMATPGDNPQLPP